MCAWNRGLGSLTDDRERYWSVIVVDVVVVDIDVVHVHVHGAAAIICVVIISDVRHHGSVNADERNSVISTDERYGVSTYRIGNVRVIIHRDVF